MARLSNDDRTHRSQTSATVTADAGASRDLDGTLVEYVWDFGDGATATGTRVSHTYTTVGTYLTTLTVKDNQGGEDFASAIGKVAITKYAFSGFAAPVDNLPTVNTMQAGRARTCHHRSAEACPPRSRTDAAVS